MNIDLDNGRERKGEWWMDGWRVRQEGGRGGESGGAANSEKRKGTVKGERV